MIWLAVKKRRKLLNNPTAATTFHNQFESLAKDVFIIVIVVTMMMKLNRRWKIRGGIGIRLMCQPQTANV